MRKVKIRDGQLIQGFKNGLTVSEMAKNLDVSTQAVRYRLKKLGMATRTEVASCSVTANELIKRIWTCAMR